MATEPDLARLYGEGYFRGMTAHVRRINQIFRHIPFKPGDQVCEFGCGLGHMLFAAHARIGYGMGIDFSEHAIAQAIQERDRRGMTKLDFVRRDIPGLALDASLKGRFDSVLMMDVTEHIYDKTLLEFLAGARHVLRETGKLYIHTPNGRYYLELLKRYNFLLRQFPGHVAVRPPDAYAELLERGGFKMESIVYLPHYHDLLGKLDQIMMRVPLIRLFFQSRLLAVAVRS